MVDTELALLVVQSDSSRKKGSAESLLYTARVYQSFTEAALQSRESVLQGVVLMVQHRHEFGQGTPVPHLLFRGQPRTELDLLMILSSFFLSLSVMLLPH